VAGNKLRFDVFKTWYNTAQRGGRELTEYDLKGMARFVNWATGRGDLGPLNSISPILSVGFFAPRYAVSRFQAPFAIIKGGYARKAIAKDLAAFYGTGLMILGLAKMGGAEIEIDPRSTEFGKIRIGDTRLDFWGGLQPIARTMAQLVTNQRKDLGGGFYSADRMITLGRFFQGKLSPSASMLVDIMRGETFIGDELTATGASLKAQAFNRLTPMFVQDLVDAVKEWGPKGAAFGILAGFGAGVQTYTTPWQVLGEARDTAAQAQGFKNFADMATNKEHGVGTKMALAMISTDTGVVAAQEKADAYRQAHGGFRPMAEIRTYFTAQQLEDDRALQAGDMTAADWRDRRNSRSDAMSVGYQVYLDSNPDLKEKYAKEAEKLGDPLALPKDASVDTMTAAYFKLFDQYRDQYTGLIDNQGWDALSADIDKFRAQFTSEQLAKLDANIGVADTDIERLYTANRKEVEASGWWAVSDNVWGKIRTTPQMVADALSTKTKPLTAADVAPLVAAGANFKDADAYAQAVFKKALQQTGSRVAAAETLANDPLMAAIGTIISDARKGIAQSNPKAAELAISWGYVTNPNLELLARALAAEGMTIGEVNRQLLAAGLTPIGTAEEKKAAMKEFSAQEVEDIEKPVTVLPRLRNTAEFPSSLNALYSDVASLAALRDGAPLFQKGLGGKVMTGALNAIGMPLTKEAQVRIDTYLKKASAEFPKKAAAALKSEAIPPGSMKAEGAYPESVSLTTGRLLGPEGITLVAHELGHEISVNTGQKDAIDQQTDTAYKSLSPDVQQQFWELVSVSENAPPEDWKRNADHYKNFGADEIVAMAAGVYFQLGPDKIPTPLRQILDPLFLGLPQPTRGIGVPPVLAPATQGQPVGAEAAIPAATAPAVAPSMGTATGGGAAATGTTISTSPAVAPAPTQEKPAVGSYEAIVSRLQGEPAYPKADVISTARVISDIGGFSLADVPPGLPPDQLKAKLAKDKPSWASWISDETWQTVGALGLTGKSTLLQVFWQMYGSAANSTLAKTVIKNEDVKRLLDNLSTMGSATVEMYMRAFEGMTRIFNEAVTGAQEDESKALGKAIASQEKKAASAAKSAAKKGAAAAEKEAEVAAEKLSWERLAEELGG
jgi:hypothetical protein